MSILLDRKRAAEMLGISPVTVDRLRAKGDLPYRRIGHFVKFLESDILGYIQKSGVNIPEEVSRENTRTNSD